jgi:hypothetical protein
MTRTWIVAVLLVAACGGGDDGSTAASSSTAECPAAFTGKDTYAYAGLDPGCQAVVDMLNAASSEMTYTGSSNGKTTTTSQKCDMGTLKIEHKGCSFHIEGMCSGVDTSADCDVHKTGTAVCAYTFSGEDDAGTPFVCEFVETIK